MGHDLNRVIKGIGFRAEDFVIFVMPQINFEPLINLYKRVVRIKKIKTILVCSENGFAQNNFTRYEWAQQGTILRTEKFNKGYVISDKTGIWYHESELENFSKANYSLSRPNSEFYLSNLLELQRHINDKKEIYDFSNHVDLRNNYSMKALHSNLLFKYKYDIEHRDYYYATYTMFSELAMKTYPNRRWDYGSFKGRNISRYFRLDKEIYDELFIKFSKLGKPYQFELNNKVHLYHRPNFFHS